MLSLVSHHWALHHTQVNCSCFLIKTSSHLSRKVLHAHTHTEEHKNTNLRLNTRITIYFNTLTERRDAERTGQKKLTPPSPGGFGPGGPGGPGLPGVPGSPSLPLGPGLPWWEKKESKEKTLAQSLSHDKTLLSVMPYSLLCLSSLGENMSKMSTHLPSHP